MRVRRVRPPTRAEHVRLPSCRAERHAMDATSCCCLCMHHSGCAAKKTVTRWYAEHTKQFQYDVCYHNHGQRHGHRVWNRDLLGALNIGCLFLAQSLERDPGLWECKPVATSPLSWAEIFGRACHVLPFSPPSALPSNGS